MLTFPLLLALLMSYLLGSVPFAIFVSRCLKEADPRTFGSGNPGATNVLRSGNKVAAALTLLLDAAKGWLPVTLMVAFGAYFGLSDGAPAAVGLAAFLGHLWSVFIGFKGGKGVATALGVLVGFSVWLGLAVLLVWLLVLALSRYSSLAAIVAALSAPIFFLLGVERLWSYNGAYLLSITFLTVLLLYRHEGNISRLMMGKEPKVGAKNKT